MREQRAASTVENIRHHRAAEEVPALCVLDTLDFSSRGRPTTHLALRRADSAICHPPAA